MTPIQDILDTAYYEMFVARCYGLYSKQRSSLPVLADFRTELSEILSNLNDSNSNYFLVQLNNEIKQPLDKHFVEADGGKFLDYFELYDSSYKEFVTSLKLIANKTQDVVLNKSATGLNTVKWKGSQVELAELIKALIHSDSIDSCLTQQQIFERFGLFFDFKINEATGVRDFLKRPNTGGELTMFLDKLSQALFEYKEERDNRKPR